MAFLLDKQKLNDWRRHYGRAIELSTPSKSKPKKSRMRKIREAMWMADSTCHYCGENLSFWNATLDHVIPVSRGGRNAQSNLVLSCKRCNQEKGAGLVLRYRRAAIAKAKGEA